MIQFISNIDKAYIFVCAVGAVVVAAAAVFP